MSRLQLIRGLPGSGKSTIASKYKHVLVIEPDMLCITDGVYDWSPEKEKRNRLAVIAFADTMMKNNIDVVVSSVMPSLHDDSLLGRILTSAKKNNVSVYIHDCIGEYGNIHDVPHKTLEGMKLAFVPAEDVIKEYQDMCIINGLMPVDIDVTDGKSSAPGGE